MTDACCLLMYTQRDQLETPPKDSQGAEPAAQSMEELEIRKPEQAEAIQDQVQDARDKGKR